MVAGLVGGGNLLHNAIWDLQNQGILEVEQVRPVVKENFVVLGGKSFSRFTVLDPQAERPGLEGALLRSARELAEPDNWLSRKIQAATGEDDTGTRRLVLALHLNSKHPWDSVARFCLDEAVAAGLLRIDKKGLFSRKKIAIADEAAVEALRAANDEIRAARLADFEDHKDWHDAVLSDCIAALDWAYNPPGSD